MLDIDLVEPGRQTTLVHAVCSGSALAQ
jgi:hypothetical protein